jgi:hypothetical protein
MGINPFATEHTFVLPAAGCTHPSRSGTGYASVPSGRYGQGTGTCFHRGAHPGPENRQSPGPFDNCE